MGSYFSIIFNGLKSHRKSSFVSMVKKKILFSKYANMRGFRVTSFFFFPTKSHNDKNSFKYLFSRCSLYCLNFWGKQITFLHTITKHKFSLTWKGKVCVFVCVRCLISARWHTNTATNGTERCSQAGAWSFYKRGLYSFPLNLRVLLIYFYVELVFVKR